MTEEVKTEEPEIAGIGHNNPPAYEVFASAITDLKEEAHNFLDGEPIENEGQADDLTRILDGMKALLKEAEATRVAEKKPHLDAGKLVDKNWKVPKEKAALVIEEAKKPLTVWRQKLQKIADDKAKALREKAEQEAEEARKARENASSLDEAEAAEEAIKESEIKRKTANKIERKPTGLRKYWEAEVTDHREFLKHVMKTNPAWLKARLEEYAQQQVVATKLDMPGVKAHEKSRAS